MQGGSKTQRWRRGHRAGTVHVFGPAAPVWILVLPRRPRCDHTSNKDGAAIRRSPSKSEKTQIALATVCMLAKRPRACAFNQIYKLLFCRSALPRLAGQQKPRGEWRSPLCRGAKLRQKLSHQGSRKETRQLQPNPVHCMRCQELGSHSQKAYRLRPRPTPLTCRPRPTSVTCQSRFPRVRCMRCSCASSSNRVQLYRHQQVQYCFEVLSCVTSFAIS